MFQNILLNKKKVNTVLYVPGLSLFRNNPVHFSAHRDVYNIVLVLINSFYRCSTSQEKTATISICVGESRGHCFLILVTQIIRESNLTVQSILVSDSWLYYVMADFRELVLFLQETKCIAIETKSI